MGKKVCALEDTGFSNVDQVMDKLVTLLPKKIKNARVQFKITNVDKNLTQMYQRLISYNIQSLFNRKTQIRCNTISEYFRF